MDEFEEKVKQLTEKILEVCGENDFSVAKQSLLNVRDYLLKIEVAALLK